MLEDAQPLEPRRSLTASSDLDTPAAGIPAGRGGYAAATCGTHHGVRHLHALSALLLAACGGSSRHTPPADALRAEPTTLSWLSGSWIEERDGKISLEHWSTPSPGVLLGATSERAAGAVVALTHLRIERRDEATVLLVSADRAPAVPFWLTSVEAARAVFESPAHDFPRRIVYQRDGDTLSARLEGDGRGVEHTYRHHEPRPAPTVQQREALIRESEAEVRALLEQQVRDWNRGDLDAFCASYGADALFLTPSGSHKGRDEILTRYRKRYEEDGREMGTLSFELLDVRVSEDAAAAAVALAWKLTWASKPASTGLALVALRREARGWRITHDASM